MNGLGLAAIHACWLATCLHEAMEFSRVSRQPIRRIQEEALRTILAANAETAFGRRYGFGRIRSVKAFQAEVPQVEYEDLIPWIEEAASGAPTVLTADPVELFELTSGSSGGTKLIPYTRGLQEAFNRAIHPWLVDLYSRRPELALGRAYWVISPRVTREERTAAGIPVGFKNDAEYFGRWGKRLIDAVMAVPSDVLRNADGESWRFATLLSLLRAEDLRLVSLWNPTFLPALLRDLAPLGDRLADALETESPGRARMLRTLLPDLLAGRDEGLGTRLWPNLRLISTWTEGEAAAGIPSLRLLFPGVQLETKGLLATEGAVTIPRSGAPAPVLAVRSGFFEFQEGEEGDGACRTAAELEPGGRYRVLITTPGGLYRYRLHDIVEMKGWWRSLPALAFSGKESMVSDLCGEKLNARHVERVLSRLLGSGSAAFLAPERDLAGRSAPHYCLFVPLEHLSSDFETLANRLEEALRENFHYRWCREAGQLGPAEVVALSFDRRDLETRRLARISGEGARAGTAKMAALDRRTGWKTALRP
ncbi:MAG TPA: GH3 auxin-responsive promoter family protein [Candidatus Ozemobacteraceae bacterium]|nr:GH3 auxin-responsive promoter family protein [Candidatus Ozemobacteraceae bacterium]